MQLEIFAGVSFFFEKHSNIKNFMKIRPVGAELFHADRRTRRHDEVNSCFFFFAILPKRLIKINYDNERNVDKKAIISIGPGHGNTANIFV